MWLLGLAGALAATQEPQYQEIPEEDEDLTRKSEYTFNPIQAAKEFKVGEFYWKKGSFRAAAGRYEEASKWNPGYAEAYWKLALARERLAEQEALETEKRLLLESARQALEKYLEAAPEGDRARDAKAKIAELGRLSAKLETP